MLVSMQLDGKLYKARTITPKRFYGILSGIAGYISYHNFAMLAQAMNPSVATFLIGACFVKFMSSFGQTNMVQSIKHKDDSDLLEIVYSETLFQTKTIYVPIGNITKFGTVIHNG